MSGNVPSLYDQDMVRIIQSIRDLYAGRSNSVGTVTLTANATTTTISHPNLAASSRIILTPTTANAAAALATTYQTAAGAQSVTLTHANNAQIDKTFLWAAFG